MAKPSSCLLYGGSSCTTEPEG
ncbi:uncharacterized protein G2W53_016433 [Senna tora]|uniref:Uncharacterized protein n=1 Tax=Senna tora TaxID=362788 RepID=A0A834TW06_9FABA|nr:uncharacterized protein G2W53_016433 [Senna tora]